MWTAPATVVAGQLMTAATWNQQVRDNEIELRAGGIAMTSQAQHDVVVATSASQLGRVANGTTGQILVATTSAVPSWKDVISALVYKSSNQSLTDSTSTLLTFEAETEDVYGLHSTSVNTSRLTIPTGGAGLYLIYGTAQFATSSQGLRGLSIIKNGVTGSPLQQIQTAGTSATNQTLMEIVCMGVLAAADYIEMYGYQGSGGALNVEASSSGTVFGCVRLRAA